MGEQGFEDKNTFGDTNREKAEADAKKLDDKIRLARPGKVRIQARRIADSYWEAIDIAKGMNKIEAVRWIQENSGGDMGHTMDSAGEVGGNVWGTQTSCNELSSWKEILNAIAYLVDKG